MNNNSIVVYAIPLSPFFRSFLFRKPLFRSFLQKIPIFAKPNLGKNRFFKQNFRIHVLQIRSNLQLCTNSYTFNLQQFEYNKFLFSQCIRRQYCIFVVHDSSKTSTFRSSFENFPNYTSTPKREILFEEKSMMCVVPIKLKCDYF